MPGPPPDPNALRRDRSNDKAEWVILPSEGRKGPPPDFPLLNPTARERIIWGQLWVKPQAVMWELQGLEWEVALMTRRLVQAEIHGSSSNNAALVKQQFDSLGLTASGMRQNRWMMSTDELGGIRADRVTHISEAHSARRRIKKAA